MDIGRFYLGIIVGLAFLTVSTTTWAGEILSAGTIVEKTIQASYSPGTNGRAQVSMNDERQPGQKTETSLYNFKTKCHKVARGRAAVLCLFSSPCRCE